MRNLYFKLFLIFVVAANFNFACINNQNSKTKNDRNKEMKTFQIHVHGIVQGVFFRKYTKNSAQENNITGFVRNESDGSVYIEATGTEDDLKNFIEWCHHGPQNASVDSVVTKEIPVTAFSSFNIKYF